MNGALRMILLRAKKRRRARKRRRAVEKASFFLEIPRVVTSRVLVAIGTVKTIPSQAESRNKVLDAGGKVILVKWLRTWLNYVCVLGLCRRQNLRVIN